jgi:hypothetical protein
MAYSSSFQFTRSADGDTDPDYVYYNASIINTSTASPWNRSVDPPVRFLETRDVPILQDASKYNFSIIRFTMNGPNKDLPLFIPVIRQGPVENPAKNVNLTIYSVSLKAVVTYTSGGITVNQTFYSAPSPVLYTPETQDARLAPVPSPDSAWDGQDLNSRYYWVYTYGHWLDLVNTALQVARDDIQTQFQAAWTAAGGAGTPVLTTKAPYITYNSSANLFTIHSDRYGFGGAARASAIVPTDDESFTLYFNSNMYGMFSNFKNTYVDVIGTERTNEIYTGPVGYTNQETVPAGSPAGTLPLTATTYWLNEQEYESTSTLWSPIESIVFNSTLLPLVFEQTGDPVVFGDSNTNTELTNSRPAFQPIITDISLPQEDANAYRELIYYAPQAEYRLASFTRSKTTLNQIDVQVYWKNRLDGKLYPVTMFNCSSVSLKIMFRRRGVYDFPHPAKMGIDV